MPFPVLARKVKKFASQHILQLKHLLSGRGFSTFKRLYRLKGELGHGGFGIVYRGVRVEDQRPVAVKFIERRHVREWAKLDEHRVPMEIALLARCARTRGVIALLDWFSIPEGFLIVMERPSPCMDLFDFIHRQKTLDEDVARFLFRQIVCAVGELVERRVLHRDLKDENILVNLMTGRIKIIDFGAATLLTRNRYHDFQGTRLYCPPEWFLHSLYLGREATVWSLGVLLYNMLNGRLPFLNEKDICTSHLLGPLPFFAALSKDARDILSQCLNFEAFSRPSLEQLLAHPWTAMCSAGVAMPEWAEMNNLMEEQEDEVEDEVEGEEEEEWAHGPRRDNESGLAPSDGSCARSRPSDDCSGPPVPAPHTEAIRMPRDSPIKFCRRNAQTAQMGGEAGGGGGGTGLAGGKHSSTRGARGPGKLGADSLDSGTASALHSPRVLPTPGGEPIIFAQF